jgi:hypothetical protein
MSEPRDVKVELDAFSDIGGGDVFEVPLEDAIRQLQAVLEAVPQELRAGAVLHIWAAGDYASIYPEVRYTRPETPDELAARTAETERRIAEAEERERREFERLRARFSGGNA